MPETNIQTSQNITQQTFAEYLMTMKSYSFYPMDFSLWKTWQLHWHGCFKNEKGQLIDEKGQVIKARPKDGYGRIL